MNAAAVRVAQKKDGEEGMDQQDIFYGVVLFLAALTRGLFRRVLGADDPSCRPVMGKRGADAVVGTLATGAGSFASAVTTVLASASETSKRCASTVRERAGASPRVRRAASSAGKRTWIHGLALLCLMPNRRPCTT